MADDSLKVVDLNVGGVFYSTTWDTLRREPDSQLAKTFSAANKLKVPKDAAGRYFLDRDGVLFRYILDYLRNSKLVLPENFYETDRLLQEATYFNLPSLVKMVNAESKPSRHPPPIVSLTQAKESSCNPLPSAKLQSQMLTAKPQLSQNTPANPNTSSDPINSVSSTTNNGSGNLSRSASPSGEGRGNGFITLGYRGTFAFGRDGLADVKFRKLSRIIICGKVSLCREVFKDTLNESRDPDRGETDRYTSRFFLKHSFLEQAFDMLLEEGFVLVASCGSGTNSAGEVKPGLDTEEAKWQHYNEFIFERRL